MERYLIVGLGNPGNKYHNTRHNIGFMAVDELARSHNLSFDTTKAKALIAEGTISGKRVLLVKPQTYMNLSGESVRALADFYKIPPENIFLVHDDMDIPLGTLRLRPKGGAGGQKGVQNTIQHLGTQDFPRCRFGIGRPPGKMDPAAYVLLPFTADEQILVIETIRRVIQAIALWLQNGIENAMNRHNGTAEEAATRFEKASKTPEPLSDTHDSSC